ncbi:hypothetical protein [Mycobacteroides abscessus]|uniref:hypothetical protein n=1 Tax=Mycobacteroides abscessus TaxID=36809 RepID=UPI00092AC16C|nr:hypothetical protein [Mycobacteroides abscessus]SIE27828.1 Uncharacterised protein [Mycobacteroides abscessus subsp. abscessus]
MQFKAIHPDSAHTVHVEAEDALTARAIAATEFGERLGRTADAVLDQVFVS